ncbi:hypothetical protein [Desulfurobacterium crinifex]
MAKKKLTLREEIYIARLLQVGTSIRTICCLFGVTPFIVRQVKERMDYKPLRFSNYLTKSKEKTLIELFKRNYPIDKIAVLLDLSGERVFRILERRGLLSRCRGTHQM